MTSTNNSIRRFMDFASGTVIHVSWATTFGVLAAIAVAVVAWRMARKR